MSRRLPFHPVPTLSFQTYYDYYEENFEDAVQAFFLEVRRIYKPFLLRYLSPRQVRKDLTRCGFVERMNYYDLIAAVVLRCPNVSPQLHQDLENFRKRFKNTTETVTRLYKLFSEFLMAFFKELVKQE